VGADDFGSVLAGVADVGAVRAVKRLQHAWSHYAEAGDLEALAELFSLGGRLVLPPRTATGRAEIHALLISVMGHGQPSYPPDRLNVPLMFSPVITVNGDGRRAHGRWHEIALTGRFGKRSSWTGGIHENEYVLEDGVWKIAVLHYHPQFAGHHSEGWRNVSDAVPLVPFHFTADTAGIPVDRDPSPRDGDSDRSRTALAHIAAAARAAIDESTILNLMAAYGHYLDRRLWDDIADLFADDGRLALSGEEWNGRDAIRRGLGEAGGLGLRTGELFEHLQLVPVVTLEPDGQSARLRGIELQMLARRGEFGRWGVRVAEARLTRTGGRWRFAELRFSPRLLADHSIGWHHDLPPLPDNSSAYPEYAGPAIEFPHPVLGAAPIAEPLEQSMGEVRRSIAVARAFDGAENVASAYGYFLDEAHWDESADLFARDGWKELSFIGTYIGRERIRDSLVARYGRRDRNPGFLPIHQKTEPVITVSADGTRAQVRLKMFQVNSGWDAPASMVTGVYEEQVILEDGIWRIHGMDLEYIVVADWADGFAGAGPEQGRKFAPTDEAIAAFDPAPDAPLRGAAFAPFPEIEPLGFHYRNPVSDRDPQVRFEWSDGRFDQPTG